MCKCICTLFGFVSFWLGVLGVKNKKKNPSDYQSFSIFTVRPSDRPTLSPSPYLARFVSRLLGRLLTLSLSLYISCPELTHTTRTHRRKALLFNVSFVLFFVFAFFMCFYLYSQSLFITIDLYCSFTLLYTFRCDCSQGRAIADIVFEFGDSQL